MSAAQLLKISREIAAIAQTGLAYTDGDYDRERYHRLREIAAELLALQTTLSAESIAETLIQTGICDEIGCLVDFPQRKPIIFFRWASKWIINHIIYIEDLDSVFGSQLVNRFNIFKALITGFMRYYQLVFWVV